MTENTLPPDNDLGFRLPSISDYDAVFKSLDQLGADSFTATGFDADDNPLYAVVFVSDPAKIRAVANLLENWEAAQ